jgi:hypothetical protein
MVDMIRLFGRLADKQLLLDVEGAGESLNLFN